MSATMAAGGADPTGAGRAQAGRASDAIEWGFDPWREHPARAATAALAALALSLFAFRLGLPFLVAASLALACIASVAPALSPARCRVDDHGVARRGPLGWDRRAWEQVRRARCGRRALVVSPYADRHWLDPYRSLVLPLPRRGSESFVGALRDLLVRHGFGS